MFVKTVLPFMVLGLVLIILLVKYDDTSSPFRPVTPVSRFLTSTVNTTSPDCPEGQYFNNQTNLYACVACPDDNYCAPGIELDPVPCPANYSLPCEVDLDCPQPLDNNNDEWEDEYYDCIDQIQDPEDEGSCFISDLSLASAHKCISGRCTNLEYAAGVCFTGATSEELKGGAVVTTTMLFPQTLDKDICGDLFTAGFRVEGEVGCETGTMCAKFQRISTKLSALYGLNQADAILEIIGAMVTVVYVVANYLKMHNISMQFNRLNVFVFMAVDVILQIAVLSISNDGEIQGTLKTVQSSNCWDLEGNAPGVLLELTSGFQWVNILGWLELGVVLIALSAALHDRLSEEEDQTSERGLKERTGLVVSILAIFFDVILSSIDFFKFTVDANVSFEKLVESFKEQESYTPEVVDTEDGEQTVYNSLSYMQKCLIVSEFKGRDAPLPTISPTNCNTATVVVDYGSKAWVAWLVVLSLLWASAISGAVYYRQKYPSNPVLKMSQSEMEGELEDQRAEARARKESSDRKDEENRRLKAEIARLKGEKDIEMTPMNPSSAMKERTSSFGLNSLFSSFRRKSSAGGSFNDQGQPMDENPVRQEQRQMTVKGEVETKI